MEYNTYPFVFVVAALIFPVQNLSIYASKELAVSGKSVCVSPCSPYCAPDQFAGDPNDCSKYRQCSAGGNWLSGSCGTSLVFDIVTCTCNYADISVCQGPCPTEPTAQPPGLCEAKTCTVIGDIEADISACEYYYQCDASYTYVRKFCSTTSSINYNCSQYTACVFDIYTEACIVPGISFSCDERCPVLQQQVSELTEAQPDRPAQNLQKKNNGTELLVSGNAVCVSPCSPYCGPGEFAGDPNDCSKYLQCGPGGTWIAQVCSPGLVFDIVDCTCDYDYASVCQAPCPPNPTEPPGLCKSTTCSVVGDIEPDKSACDYYYQCDTSYTYVRKQCTTESTINYNCTVATACLFDIYSETCVVPGVGFTCDERCPTIHQGGFKLADVRPSGTARNALGKYNTV